MIGTAYSIGLRNVILTAEHCKRLGGMTPFYLFAVYVDRTTSEKIMDGGPEKIGIVNGGHPLTDAELAEQFRVGKWRVRNCRRVLRREKYIFEKDTPAGPIIRVNKSKKWLPRFDSDKSELRSPPVGGPAGISRRSDYSEPAKSYKAANAANAAVETRACVNLEAWKAIGLGRPVGDSGFRCSWETAFASKGASPLSRLMGDCADSREEAGGKVPATFFRELARIRNEEKYAVSIPSAPGIKKFLPEEIPA